MKVRKINVNKLPPPTFSFDAFSHCQREDYLFFDIETLGFHRISHPVALIGVARMVNGETQLLQWMCDSPDEEIDLLMNFFSLITEKTVLISFNGMRFDWPFLAARAKKHRILPPQPKSHLDLFQFYHAGFSDLGYSSHTLRTLTQANFHFESILSKEVPELLRCHFQKPADSSPTDVLFLHNQEDLLGLFALEELMEKTHSNWQLRLANGTLALQSIQSTTDYYLIRYQPSNSDMPSALICQGKNHSIDWIQKENIVEFKFRYLAVEKETHSIHLFPNVWFPFNPVVSKTRFSRKDIPDELKIIKIDEETDRLLLQAFCRAAIHNFK